MKFMNNILGEEPKKNILCNRYFIWLVFLASIQPDLLLQKSFVVTLFSGVTILACGLVCLDILLRRAFQPKLSIAMVLLVQLCLIFSTVLHHGNFTFSVKKMLMIMALVMITHKNLKINASRFVRDVYWLLYGCIAIHFVTLLLFPVGIYTSYYEVHGRVIPYLRHWFLSTGNNYVIFVLPAMFLDRLRLRDEGKKTDLFSLLLWFMGFFGMFKSHASTSLVVCGLFVLFVVIIEWKNIPAPPFWGYVLLGVALFVMLVYGDLGAIVGNLLGIGEIHFTGRTKIWAYASEWAAKSPVFGYGLEYQKLLIEKMGGNNVATHCHNLYMDLFYRSGLLGLGCFLATMVLCGFSIDKRKKHPMAKLMGFTLFLYLGVLFQMEAYFNLTLFYVLVMFAFHTEDWVGSLLVEKIDRDKNMTIYVCETVYHVMLATLLLRGQDNIIICTTHETKNMENFRNLRINAIPEAHFFLRFRHPRKENLGLEMLEDRRILSALQEQYGFRNFDLVNFAWSANSIDRSSAYYYKKCRRATFYEEGAMGCIGVPQSKKKLLVKQLLGIPVRFHGDKKLQAVYVQNPDLYDDRFGDKLRSFDLRSLMEDSQVGSRVVGLFMDEEKAEKMSDINGKSIIFTQPLSEDGYISEERKVEIYSVICDWFNSEQTILKIHPRDTSDYAAVKANVLRETFPGELFDVLGVRFDAAVGICTSAVNNVDAAHPVNLNPDFLKDTHFDAEEMADLFEKNGVLKSQ
ncbi:MAG: O-antigen ligase family protein [Oscillospiraceae bacterium]|nr:O-antigen ligase family protein [Oscillospiraceae bacterium]